MKCSRTGGEGSTSSLSIYVYYEEQEPRIRIDVVEVPKSSQKPVQGFHHPELGKRQTSVLHKLNSPSMPHWIEPQLATKSFNEANQGYTSGFIALSYILKSQDAITSPLSAMRTVVDSQQYT